MHMQSRLGLGRIFEPANPQKQKRSTNIDQNVWMLSEMVNKNAITCTDNDGQVVSDFCSSYSYTFDRWNRETLIHMPGAILSTQKYDD